LALEVGHLRHLRGRGNVAGGLSIPLGVGHGVDNRLRFGFGSGRVFSHGFGCCNHHVLGVWVLLLKCLQTPVRTIQIYH